MKLNRAFTLVEMLVVVAVLGILAALLLPVLVKAKEKARSTTCQNNLKQLGVAARLSLDANGTWPVQPIELEAFSSKLTGATIHNTPTDSSIWYCPAWKDGRQNDTVGTYGFNRDGSGNVNDTLADKPLGLATGPGGKQGRKEQEIASPMDMIVMGEMHELGPISSPPPHIYTGAAFLQTFPFNRRCGYFFIFRHNQRANTLFGDGHVESSSRDGLIGGDDSVRRRWNYDNQPHDENWR
jgi:prepilin-type N-terminal cleavage/methylation domain-containing protein/prepilin-type processing-associated H-X9-DG protein